MATLDHPLSEFSVATQDWIWRDYVGCSVSIVQFCFSMYYWHSIVYYSVVLFRCWWQQLPIHDGDFSIGTIAGSSLSHRLFSCFLYLCGW